MASFKTSQIGLMTGELTIDADLAASLATIVIATKSSGYKADYYTDGVNDQVQIQTAIDLVTTLGGIVFLRRGTYTIQDSIIMKSRVILRGEGKGTKLAGKGTQFSVIEGHGGIGTEITDFEIADLFIDGTNLVDTSYSTDTKGIYMTFMQRGKFLNLYIYNTPATALGVDFFKESLIHGVVADTGGRQFDGSIGSNGIGIGTGRYEDETLIISDCHAINCGNNGIMIEHQANGSVGKSRHLMISDCTARLNKVGFRNAGVARVVFNSCYAIDNVNDGFLIGNNSSQYGSDTAFTNCIASENGSDGIQIQDINTAESRFIFSNNQIIGNTNNGIKLRNSNHIVTGNIIQLNGRSGIHWFNSSGTVKDVVISNNQIFNNGTSSTAGQTYGIYIQSSGGLFDGAAIQGNRIYDNQGTVTQTYGIRPGANGTAANIINLSISGNDLRTSGTAFHPDIGTVSSSIVRNNVGYNPVGASSISPGASPYTYTAGLSPETIYVTSGTVSSIAKNSVTLFSSTEKSLNLEPNESLIVTYSAAPTMSKDVH